MMYRVTTPFGLRRPYSGWIRNRHEALKRCQHHGHCSGVSEYSRNGRRYRLHRWGGGHRAEEDHNRMNDVSFEKIEGEAVISNGMSWSRVERKSLHAPLSNHMSPSVEAAITSCSSNKKCRGITRWHNNRYQLFGDSRTQNRGNAVSYIKGSPVTVVEDKYWTSLPGYKFEVQGNRRFTTLNDAMTACVESYKKNMGSGRPYCVGVMKKSEHNYFMGKSLALIEETSSTVWILGGDEVKFTTASMSYDGYSYDMIKPMKLEGRVDGRRYHNRNIAMQHCNKNPRCKGIVRERPHHFFLMGGTTPTPADGQISYIKSGRAVMVSRTLWTRKDGVELKGAYGNRKYTSRDSALKACGAASGCKGVTKYGSGNFRLRGSSTTASKSGASSWIQGDSVIEEEDFYWSEKVGYKIDFKLSGHAYSNKGRAFKDCAKRHNQCSGVTKTNGKYYIMRGAGLTKSPKDKTYLMGDLVKSTSYTIFGNKAWTIRSPYAMASCYRSYRSLYEALDRCAEEKRCRGVSRHHSEHFALCRSVSITVLVHFRHIPIQLS